MRISFYLFYISALILSMCSCEKGPQENLGNGALTTVEVSLSSAGFDAIANIGNPTATIQGFGLPDEILPLQHTMEVGNDLLLVAELIPQEAQGAYQTSARAARSESTKAQVERTNLAEHIRYKVAVYDNSGNFITERDYIHGSEAATPVLQLDHGRTYTFVVYSVNSSNLDGSGLPGIVFVGGSRTLAASTFVAPGNSDPMYFKQTMTLNGAITNRLDIILKHRFSQITTIINTAQTGYLPKDITASFTPHQSSASINLENGVITRTGTPDRATVSATFSESESTVSYTTIINSDANTNTSYNIASFTVGDLTLRNLKPFTDLKITPGVKYNLLLNLVPTDAYVEHAGLPAVRIGKTIWARHNVGVDPALDPDASPLTAAHHGNYYQWGSNLPSGTGTATTAEPFNDSNNPADNSWNSGTEDNPIKAAADPCPAGFRIPTRKEVGELVQNMTAVNVGESRNSREHYNSAKQLTSKRKRGIIMTLPSQGWLTISGGQRPYNNGGSQYRGSEGYYHSSYAQGDAISHLYFSRNSFSQSNRSANQMNKVVSMTIRCVAE